MSGEPVKHHLIIFAVGDRVRYHRQGYGRGREWGITDADARRRGVVMSIKDERLSMWGGYWAMVRWDADSDQPLDLVEAESVEDCNLDHVDVIERLAWLGAKCVDAITSRASETE